jgi:hypothetical protein
VALEAEMRSKKIASSERSADWRCISVAPEADEQFEFSYTTGVWRNWHHPEVSIFGLPSAIAAKVLGTVVSRIRDGVKLEEGQEIGDVLQGGWSGVA